MPTATEHKPTLESVTSINQDGSHYIIHPADVSGRFTVLRRMFALALVAVYVLLPWIEINGFPAVFLDAVNRRFHLFGLTFAAQDLWLAFFLISGMGFLLFYLTALFGRIWCGWACPQTVFLEHFFRRVERWLEGGARQRQRLDRAPWTTGKAIRRGTKHLVFFLLAVVIAHIFLSYFVSLPTLYSWMHEAPAVHWHAFLFVFLLSAVLYFNFAYFREQLCIIICPYGRLQSALIDDHSLVIGYDEKRGEPRGRPSDKGSGDCVDCFRCVDVCPTGIDIRQGLQMECIGCSACIDACDTVMRALDRPTGLIRYDSLNGLSGRKTQYLRPRTVLYSALLLLGASVMFYSFARIQPAQVGIVRMRGAPFYVDETTLRNQFFVRLINKTSTPMAFDLNLSGGSLHWSGFNEAVIVAPMGELLRPLVISVDREGYQGPFAVTATLRCPAASFEAQYEIRFLGPDPSLLKSAGLEDPHSKTAGHPEQTSPNSNEKG